MSELDKLEKYLKDNNIAYERLDEMPSYAPFSVLKKNGLTTMFHQICVPSRKNCKWDVICHKGSYGYEEGLLELMGSLLTDEERKEDSVVGYLTADNIIKRMENEE